MIFFCKIILKSTVVVRGISNYDKSKICDDIQTDGFSFEIKFKVIIVSRTIKNSFAFEKTKTILYLLISLKQIYYSY